MYCANCGTDNPDGSMFCNKCGKNFETWEEPMDGVKTQTGLQKNVAALLSYLLGWISGLVFFFIEKDPYIRFHAMQSIIVFGGLNIVTIILSNLMLIRTWVLFFMLSLLNALIIAASIFFWILLMIKAYQGIRFKLPLVGDLAEKYSKAV
ncbi:MAG: zinc-ribbon domain-containing protein [Bacillota bacterium]